MSIDKIKQAKSNGVFKRGDIIIYAIILLVIVVLFVSIFFTQSKDELTTIHISLRDEEIFVYNFTEENYEVLNNKSILVEKDADVVKLTIYTDEDKEHFNIVQIKVKEKKVYLIEANCSLSRDCTHMVITKVGDSIICVPHNLIISTNKKVEIENPSVG